MKPKTILIVSGSIGSFMFEKAIEHELTQYKLPIEKEDNKYMIYHNPLPPIDYDFYEPKVHPKHFKSPLIPQKGYGGNINRSKSKRKRK
jgi:hypothetical protein